MKDTWMSMYRWMDNFVSIYIQVSNFSVSRDIFNLIDLIILGQGAFSNTELSDWRIMGSFYIFVYRMRHQIM